MQFDNRYEQIFNYSPLGMVIYNNDSIIQDVNPAFLEILECSRMEIISASFTEFMHPEDIFNFLSLTEAQFRENIQGFKTEIRFLKKDGNTVWVSISAVKLSSEKDTGLAIAENITERITIESALTHQTEKLVNEMQKSRLLNEKETAPSENSPEKKRILMIEDDIFLKKTVARILEKNGLHFFDAGTIEEALQMMKEDTFDLIILDLNLPDKTGYDLLEELEENTRPPIIICSSDSKKENYPIAFRMGADDYMEKPLDMQELLIRIKALLRIQQKLAMAKFASNTDEMTELHNGRSFKNYFDELIEESRNEGKHFAVLSIDINSLKPVNDEFGHASGDVLIKSTADAIRKCAPENGFCARIGGDEFAVLIPDAGLMQTEEFIYRLRKSLPSYRFNAKNKEIEPSVSIGYSFFPENGNTKEELLHYSDVSMYKNKAIIKAQMRIK